jgi:hypothetical protein
VPIPAFVVAKYRKPATVLVALRGLLGEETFMRAHREFMRRWAYRIPYPWDFFRTIEDVSGQDLWWFWRTWYDETWVLDQAIWDVEDNGDSVTIEIRDLGEIPMPVKLLVILEDSTEIREELPVTHWIEGKRTATTTIETGRPVSEVIIDPDYHFPDVDRTNNYWEK